MYLVSSALMQEKVQVETFISERVLACAIDSWLFLKVCMFCGNKL